MPIRPGEVFSRSKIGTGLQEVTKLYESLGYANFTADPKTVFEETNAGVALKIDVVEGHTYRFGELKLGGLDQKITDEFLYRWSELRGQVYSQQKYEDFYLDLVRHIPEELNAGSKAGKHMNEQLQTVDVDLTFFPKDDPASIQQKHL
jgi:outer membrane protein assembly factor BamA